MLTATPSQSSQAQELYPVILGGISHYEFVRIHPFVDGNGRTARALSTLILYFKGFDTKRFFALDDYYNEERGRYYGALQTVDPKTLDTTKWLELLFSHKINSFIRLAVSFTGGG